MKRSNLLSITFVFVQFLCLGIFAITGPVIPSNAILFLGEGLGIALGLWAIWTMRLGNFNITPDVKRGARLILNGPYRYIRHPMYTGLLLVTLTLLVNSFTPWRLVVWLVLLVDLMLKLNYEENLLRQEQDGYVPYMEQSKRLIPFLF
jgi:protein-S-isoprenylcysteine O-methyltransferase Ste14